MARLFQRLLALTFVVAWLSLGAQVLVLVGAHGLLPVASWLAALHAHGVSWADAPTWLWLGASDRALRIGICFGVLLAVLAACELRPQLCFALSTALYLGYAVGCRGFLAFQWDNLLLECGALSAFLPARRSSRWIHVLFRLLLFKLYFESGLAKLESPLGDWVDGSAMRFYYQTAPLPTALAYFCHALPPLWHRVESNLTLVWELCVPLLIWGPRRARRAAFAVFSCFQLLNIATANYGFFSYLALFMGVFLLDEGDIWRTRDFLAARLSRPALQGLSLAAREVHRARTIINRAPRLPVRWLRGLRCAVATIVTASWAGLSIDGALHLFAHQAFAPLDLVADVAAPFRIVSDYHLFMQVTRERIEPTFEAEGRDKWSELALHYMAGPVSRAPPFVAPHQPRVDFLLWFYGLSFEGEMPPYVTSLLGHLCRDPGSVQPLFSSQLPSAPRAVKIVFFEYAFTRPGSKDWWTRREVAHTAAYRCH